MVLYGTHQSIKSSFNRTSSSPPPTFWFYFPPHLLLLHLLLLLLRCLIVIIFLFHFSFWFFFYFFSAFGIPVGRRVHRETPKTLNPWHTCRINYLVLRRVVVETWSYALTIFMYAGLGLSHSTIIHLHTSIEAYYCTKYSLPTQMYGHIIYGD